MKRVIRLIAASALTLAITLLAVGNGAAVAAQKSAVAGTLYEAAAIQAVATDGGHLAITKKAEAAPTTSAKMAFGAREIAPTTAAKSAAVQTTVQEVTVATAGANLVTRQAERVKAVDSGIVAVTPIVHFLQ